MATDTTIAAGLNRIISAKAALKTAIEAKGVTVGSIDIDGYAAKVDLIEQGGGGLTTGNLVRFIDFDGTILKEEYITTGNDATPPTAPTHDLLTFDQWNHPYTNIQKDTDIGALYNTTGNHTYMWITLTRATGYAPVIYLNKATTATMTIYNHDTNAVLATSSASGNVNLTLNFGEAGDYVIRIECGGNWKLGQGSITSRLFYNATYKAILKKIYVGNIVVQLNDNVFRESNNLVSIALHSAITLLGTAAFYNCVALQSITIPSSVTSISVQLLYNCYNIEKIIISSSVTSISANAFYYCLSLQSITIPSSVTSIGDSAFIYCVSIQSITIPSSVTSIGANAFYNCLALQSITIPSSVTSINSYTFYYCLALQSITIPSSVTSIGANAFYYCLALQSITIPSSVTSINSYTFYYCLALQSITIPSSVTSIGDNAFRNCLALQSITIPSSVTSISANAFYNNSFTNEYVINATTPPTLANTNAFTGIISTCKIRVPVGTLAAYQSATNWATYAAYMVEQ